MCRRGPYTGEWYATNLNVDKKTNKKTVARAVIMHLQKKCLIPKKSHEDIVRKLAEDSLSYVNVKKWGAEFRYGRDTTEDDQGSSRPKALSTIDARPSDIKGDYTEKWSRYLILDHYT